jgi:nitroimidazol reductase NimA-like FMN-containing flavoprotein (pyridoxamine 5'-phosphate oxidase superfamily)
VIVNSDEVGEAIRVQRRGRSIAMTGEEVDTFLAFERTCRVATVGASGAPDISPLWFVWDGTSCWLNSLYKSQRWTNLVRDPRIAIVMDAGEQFHELRGVEISGEAEIVGEVPRTAEPLSSVAWTEREFARKYMGGGEYKPDGRHAWVRVRPAKVVSWDFRKNPALKRLS